MEEKSKKNIYFLYSQKGDKNNVQAIETNDKVIKVNEIHKEIYDNSIQILYKLEILINNEVNKINISLINIQGENYSAQVELNNTELDLNNNDIIIFKVQFKPYFNNEKNNLNQIFLPYDKQFDILERIFIDNENILINLYASIISQVFLVSKTKYDFIFNFFLKIYDEKKMTKFPQFKSILKYFFKNITQILKNCEVSRAFNISEEKVCMLSDIENIRT